MCWSDRQERLRSTRKWSLEQNLAGSKCEQERWNKQPEHGWKPEELCMQGRECKFFQDEHYRITAYYVNSWERTCFHMLRSPKVTAVLGTTTRRKEQLSVLTDQPRHLLWGSLAPQLCSTPPLALKIQSLFNQYLADSPRFAIFSNRPQAFYWVSKALDFLGLCALNFSWPACSSVLLGWAVTVISLTDQVSIDDLFYFCLSFVEYNHSFI